MIYDPSWRQVEVSSPYFYNDILLGNVGKLILIEAAKMLYIIVYYVFKQINANAYILVMNKIGIT